MNIEYAIVADHAEIVGGRLFLMGGGRAAFNVDKTPGVARIAVAVGVRIGWEETNRPHKVRLVAEDEDGKELVRVEAAVNVGRPPDLPPGAGQLAQIASNVPLSVQAPGSFALRVTAGEDDATAQQLIPFRVTERPPQRPGAQPGSA